jgi:quinol monooxygenase YgiN
MAAIVLVVELEIAPGEKERFLARAREHRDNVLANEPGCRQFDILALQDRDDAVILVEAYADAGALETHFNTPYMKEYLADTGPMIVTRKRTPCDLANE